MITSLSIKPLSVNDAYATSKKGKRVKTKACKKYCKDLMLILPKMERPSGKLKINIEFGFSNVRSDVDNPAKIFIDVLQKKYGFNDNKVYELNLVKNVVKKGQEYIKFEIKQLIGE